MKKGRETGRFCTDKKLRVDGALAYQTLLLEGLGCVRPLVLERLEGAMKYGVGRVGFREGQW